MSKKLQLNIADPCHENWDNMAQADRGRFCASCQKEVIDFSNMSDSQLAAFFKRPPSGSVCGRFHGDQLDRDIEIPKKRIPWVKYFFQFALPAFLISMKATAQGKVKTNKKDSVVVLEEVVMLSKRSPGPITNVQATLDPPGKNINLLLAGLVSGPVITTEKPANPPLSIKPIPQLIIDAGKIKGRVVDNNGTPVVPATIIIKGSNKAVETNVNGEFVIVPDNDWKSVVLMVLAVGFTSQEVTVTNNNPGASVVVQLALQPMVGGEVVVVGGLVSCKRSKKQAKSIPALTQKLMDTAYKFFKIFPNPVSSGASLHIEWKQTEEGYYTFDLVDLSGRKVYSKEIWIDAEARLLNLELPPVATGSYFLRATNKNSGKRFTEKVIIE
jgi:CarboxypepD_reg-like domain/Secretion system C-terminal sorting domain